MASRHMLNRIDWLGAIVQRRKLNDEKVIFSSIGYTLIRIINLSKSLIVADTKIHGIQYWAGVLAVGKKLKIDWVINLLKQNNGQTGQ